MKVKVFNRKNYQMILTMGTDSKDSVIVPPMSQKPVIADLTQDQIAAAKAAGFKVETI